MNTRVVLSSSRFVYGGNRMGHFYKQASTKAKSFVSPGVRAFSAIMVNDDNDYHVGAIFRTSSDSETAFCATGRSCPREPKRGGIWPLGVILSSQAGALNPNQNQTSRWKFWRRSIRDVLRFHFIDSNETNLGSYTPLACAVSEKMSSVLVVTCRLMVAQPRKGSGLVSFRNPK